MGAAWNAGEFLPVITIEIKSDQKGLKKMKQLKKDTRAVLDYLKIIAIRQRLVELDVQI